VRYRYGASHVLHELQVLDIEWAVRRSSAANSKTAIKKSNFSTHQSHDLHRQVDHERKQRFSRSRSRRSQNLIYNRNIEMFEFRFRRLES
jgi:hypothetical protein